jgi:hypothetical protein
MSSSVTYIYIPQQLWQNIYVYKTISIQLIDFIAF